MSEVVVHPAEVCQSICDGLVQVPAFDVYVDDEWAATFAKKEDADQWAEIERGSDS